MKTKKSGVVVRRVSKRGAAVVSTGSSAEFDQIVALIEGSRRKVMAAANSSLIDLYWAVGKYVSDKIAREEWGTGTVSELSRYIARKQPNMLGFSAKSLWRMTQFYETYKNEKKLAPLVRELSWSHNLLILGRAKRVEEREFYLRTAVAQKWNRRELDRQLSGALFERVVLSPVKVAPAVRQIRHDVASIFKDSYLVEFLNLPGKHSEKDLHRGLVAKLKDFLVELGRDFCFVGSHYPLQVGKRDFELDLLFFNRAINCLVAVELKIEAFEPEHLGKLQFYLEALDRDVRKAHEGPTIGVLLCASKDAQVVEYALSRSASPTVVAEYQTRLPDKRLLEAKLHEFYEEAQAEAERAGRGK